jgi:hypothetical protein
MERGMWPVFSLADCEEMFGPDGQRRTPRTTVLEQTALRMQPGLRYGNLKDRPVSGGSL